MGIYEHLNTIEKIRGNPLMLVHLSICLLNNEYAMHLGLN